MKKHPEQSTTDQETPELDLLGRIYCGVGFLLLLCLLTQGRMDPNPVNLYWPPGGLSNWLGLPGALLAGALLHSLGWVAYGLPLYLLFFRFEGRDAAWLQLLLLGFCLLVGAMVVGLAWPELGPDLYLAAGSWGYHSRLLLAGFLGRWFPLLVLGGFLFRLARPLRPHGLSWQALQEFILLLLAAWETSRQFLRQVQADLARQPDPSPRQVNRLDFSQLGQEIMARLNALPSPSVLRSKEETEPVVFVQPLDSKKEKPWTSSSQLLEQAIKELQRQKEKEPQSQI